MPEFAIGCSECYVQVEADMATRAVGEGMGQLIFCPECGTEGRVLVTSGYPSTVQISGEFYIGNPP